jgi:hypothetical protein
MRADFKPQEAHVSTTIHTPHPPAPRGAALNLEGVESSIVEQLGRALEAAGIKADSQFAGVIRAIARTGIAAGVELGSHHTGTCVLSDGPGDLGTHSTPAVCVRCFHLQHAALERATRDSGVWLQRARELQARLNSFKSAPL